MRHLIRWMMVLCFAGVAGVVYADVAVLEVDEPTGPVFDERLAGFEPGEPEPLPWRPPTEPKR